MCYYKYKKLDDFFDVGLKSIVCINLDAAELFNIILLNSF